MSKASTFQKVKGVSNLYHRAGRYYARLSIGGKPTWRSLDTDKVREAKNRLAQFFTGKASEAGRRKEPSLYQAIDQCLEFRRSRRGVSRPLSPATIKTHGELRVLARKILPDRKLSQFRATDITNAIGACGQSASRRKQCFEVIKGAYARAVTLRQIDHNPLEGIVPDQVERKERNLPTRKQLEEVCDMMEAMFPEAGRAAALTARFLAFSGLRISEAKGVDWTHISGGKLKVRGLDGRLKTRRSRRSIHINDPLQATLDEIAGVYGRKGPVLPTHKILIYLKPACDEVGIERLTHHDLRSWYCTWCLKSGIDVPTVADWLGDDPATTLRTYAQVDEEAKEEAARKLK